MARRVNKKREISAVLYFAAALLLAVTFYVPAARTGFLGQFLVAGGRGLLGVAALALPVVFLYMAIDYTLAKRLKVTQIRFAYVFLLLLAVAALLHLITVTSSTLRTLALDAQGVPQATKALRLLFTTGIEPEQLGQTGLTLPGGLLGGGLALALDQIAGFIGGIVILSALILSMLILWLNVSVSKAVGKTAKAVSDTRRRVDEAVRNGAEVTRPSDLDPESYDLEVPETKPEDKEGPEMTLPTSESKSGWKQSLSRLWSSRREDDENEEAATDYSEDPDSTSSLPKEEEGIRQKSAYDLEVKRSDWLMTPNDEEDAPSIPTFGTPESEKDEKPLPAGVHRVHDPASSPKSASSSRDADDGLDRDRWADRSDDPGSAAADQARPSSGQQMGFPWQPPSLKLLTADQKQPATSSNLEINRLGRKLERTLEDFGIKASVVRHSTGPTITRFELTPGSGVKVSRIVNLADDIALNLAAMGVRIEAPIPGKAAIGIEIPNKETTPVLLRGMLESPEYKKNHDPLTVAIGRDIQGSPILCDLTKMPHLLIAGATGSGKSVCINSILMSILFKAGPEDVKLVMIDPKVVELNVYNGIPHLITPVVTDPKKAANALIWAVNEMTRRYGLFAEKSVRDIRAYRDAAQYAEEGEYEKLPLILLVIDELSDLMATSPTEVEDAIARLTAMARAAGIHLIIATQRPSVDVITGVIKANIPSRIAFAVASQVDSRTILDTGGAEKLLGKGDLLYYPQSAAKPMRGQGAFISDPEVERVLKFIKGQHSADYDESVTEMIKSSPKEEGKNKNIGAQDELLPQALQIVVEAGYASVSILQRRMNVGYPRAARLIDTLHSQGYIGPFEGSKPRKVLISPTQLMELEAKKNADDSQEDS